MCKVDKIAERVYTMSVNIRYAIALFLILSGASLDEYTLATAIEGEAAMFLSNQSSVADRVGQVVVNRLEAGWCKTIRECVDGGFWGAQYVRIPTQAALESAQRVLKGETNQTNDMFVFSASDVEALNLGMDLATHIARKGDWVLAFFNNNINLKEKQQ